MIIDSSTSYGFFSGNPRRYRYTVATRHERQTRYYGTWLSLTNSFIGGDYKTPDFELKAGLVKLRQPRAGYADVRDSSSWDPRNLGNIAINLTDNRGREIPNDGQNHQTNPSMRGGSGKGGARYVFRIFASLEEAAEGKYLSYSERLTEEVTQALDFVATGQPPDPRS